MELHHYLEDTVDCVRVRFSTRTYRTPFYLEKTLTLQRHSSALKIEERIQNEGGVPMEYVWGQHPTFGPPFLDETCVLDAPACELRTMRISERSRCPDLAGQHWPVARGLDKESVDLSRVLSPESGVYDMAYLGPLQEGWFALTSGRQRLGFGMAWPAGTFPYLWFWQVYGGAFEPPWYGRTYNVGIEPWSTQAPSLEQALLNGTHNRLEAGATVTTSIVAVVYSGIERVRRISQSGEVIAA